MRNLLIASLASMTMFAAIGAAQIVDPPTVDKEHGGTVSSSVTINAWDLECTFFRLVNHDAIFIDCFQGNKEVLNTRVYPPNNTSVSGGLVLPKATYAWTFSQGPPNVFTYTIITNTPTVTGFTTTGTF